LFLPGIGTSAEHPFEVGEVLNYDVTYLLGMRGKAHITVVEKTLWEENEVYHITFDIWVGGDYFSNKIDIYASITDMLPLRITTDTKRGGKVLKGLQIYRPQERSATFSQTSGQKTKVETFTRKGPIQDITTVVYYLRGLDWLEGQKYPISLKQGEYLVRSDGFEQIKVPFGSQKQKALLVKSDPPALKVWFSIDEKRYPLRIEIGEALGKFKMNLRNVEEKKFEGK